MTAVSIEINGQQHSADVEPRLLLADFIREQAGLTGTHLACEHGACGACTVLLDERAVRSCLVLAVQASGRRVRTVESLAAQDGRLHPIQQAFHECHGLQCGFCTPGFLMATVDLLARQPRPTEQEVRKALSGNLCRCTGYQGIVDAVLLAAARMRGDDTA